MRPCASVDVNARKKVLSNMSFIILVSKLSHETVLKCLKRRRFGATIKGRTYQLITTRRFADKKM
jgi:hypothetical protein